MTSANEKKRLIIASILVGMLSIAIILIVLFSTNTVGIRNITIKIPDMEVEYSGNEVKVDSYYIKSGSLRSSDVISLEFSDNTIKEIGSITPTVTYKILNSNYTDVSYLYEITLEIGTVKVIPRKLTINVDSSYQNMEDGTYELSSSEYELVSQNKLLQNHTIEKISLTISETNHTYTILVKNGNGDVSSLYELIVNYR